MSSCNSYNITLFSWIFGLLALLAVQVAVDQMVQDNLGQATTSLLMMIIITVKYNPFDFCCAFFRARYVKKIKEEDTTIEAKQTHDAEGTQIMVVDPSSQKVRAEPYLPLGEDSSPAREEEVVVDDCSAFLSITEDTTADNNPQPPPSRLIFLDNLKSFLTFLVVTLHVCCAFGACQGFWFLILGEQSVPKFFSEITRQLSMLLQGFFMPLFFFVSAFFVPTSYNARPKHQFFQAKRRKLYYPAMFVIFTVVPLCGAIGHWVAARDNPSVDVLYIFMPAHCWFNLWLLALHWVYVTLTSSRERKSDEEINSHEKSTESSNDTTTRQRPFPSTWKRMTSSLIICGVLLIPCLALTGPVTFAGMPMLNGSLTCDFYMYVMGVWARNNGWLDRPLKDQMDIPPWMHRLIVLAEASIMVTLFHFYDLARAVNVGPVVGFFLTSGMYTVDMGLMLVQLFQSTVWLNADNKYSRFFSKAAYTVYLIHPLVIVGVSAIYLLADDNITFAGSEANPNFLGILAPPGHGGEDTYFFGWCIILVASQLIVWPLAWCIASIPYLKSFL